MRSPLEILEGRFEHALLTTYSFNLRFFEEWVLRALWAAEVRNVIVFVDHHELGQALADKAPSAAGRAYHVVSAKGVRGAFHPKVILASGAEGARLCVSSANLTADGQLRNAESAIAFDSHLAGHERPIIDAGDLFRRLSEGAPAHTAAAIQEALASLPDAGDDGPYRLIHNLDRPLVEAFPSKGPIKAVTPYVDASGTAARRLNERGPLTVVVDGDQIAASTEFFSAPWTVEARRFDARLHGKAYEVQTPEGPWVLVGSPNLSEPALLRSAAAGNLEVAVAVTGQALDLPKGAPWDESDLPSAAAARLDAKRKSEETEQQSPRAFDAWEDGRRIVVSGVPDGSRIERWSNEQWHPIGIVTDGAVYVADPEIRPTRVRAVTSDGRISFAVVAQPSRLRARMRAATRGRQTEAVRRLPLDFDTVRILEDALSQLYALSELAGDQARSTSTRKAAHGEPTPDASEKGLLGWMPRTPDEEPRVPPLYTKAWEGEPDALFALISRVLRIEPDDSDSGESEVALESVDLDELESARGTAIESGEEEPTPAVDGRELDRYRKAFVRLFERGQEFMVSAADPTIAGWAFTYLLTLVEDLGSHKVEVDGKEQKLMHREPLRAITLDLLENYLHRDEHDLLCLASARAHLATAIREYSRYTVRDKERIDSLAYSWASELVSVPADVPAPAKKKLDLDATAANVWLEDYAHRSAWDAIGEEAAARLEGGTLRYEPFPTIIGEADFEGRVDSPAWSMLAFAAPAGYASTKPFGVVLQNAAPSPVEMHILVCIPESQLIVEAFRRTSDAVWVERKYSALTRSVVDDLTGPWGLEVAEPSTEYQDPGDSDTSIRTLRSLVESLAT
jgi:hypothetical protein